MSEAKFTEIYGLPTNFMGLYTFYSDLTKDPTTNAGLAGLKRKLWQGATERALQNTQALSLTEHLNKANSFLKAVATSERNKEIAMIQSFSDKTKQTFPGLQKYFNDPSKIQDNLSDFYANLTAAITVARRGTTEYLNELKRIKKNILDKSKRTLETYKADDFRYRLDGDISSFLNRLTGNFSISHEKEIQKDAEQLFAVRVQNLATKILSNFGLTSLISSGEDFSAIAASLLVELEAEIQKEMDEQLLNKTKTRLDQDIDDILIKIEQRYDQLANKQRLAKSPIEKALTDITSIEYTRITTNAKEILNIHTDLTQDQEEIRKKIESKDTSLNNNKRVKRNKEIQEIRNRIKTNTLLRNNLGLVKFSISGSCQTKHGSINELVLSLLNNGTNVKGNAATDIISFIFEGHLSIDQSVLNQLVANIGKAYTETVAQQVPNKDDKKIKDTTHLVNDMNEKITELIKEAEKKLKEQSDFNLDDIFVFHESLKLYSSAETGRHFKGFEGRSITLMSYIDNLYSMQATIGNKTPLPISRDEMGFIGINLAPGAAAEKQKEPLENYLSLYAGMLMFDDVANIAAEAAVQMDSEKNNQTPSTGIRQIHLYNLNGMYVPASMFLSYLSNAVNNTATMIQSGSAMRATISVPSSNKAYAQYMKERYTSKDHLLTLQTWEEVAAENSQNTKISITFLTAFKAFINSLPII